MSTWHGLYAPAGTAEPVEPATVERATPAIHRRFLAEEVVRWRLVIQAAGGCAD